MGRPPLDVDRARCAVHSPLAAARLTNACADCGASVHAGPVEIARRSAGGSASRPQYAPRTRLSRLRRPHAARRVGEDAAPVDAGCDRRRCGQCARRGTAFDVAGRLGDPRVPHLDRFVRRGPRRLARAGGCAAADGLRIRGLT